MLFYDIPTGFWSILRFVKVCIRVAAYRISIMTQAKVESFSLLAPVRVAESALAGNLLSDKSLPEAQMDFRNDAPRMENAPIPTL
ncbi:MAG TPA: hypothetical protein VIM11_21200 [Tepidisphaeraceae bacterium]|jgi:hypothetical protein